MTSVNAIISTALRKLGALSAGETAPAEEAAEALAELRRMLDAWSLEDLLIPFHVTERFPLSSTQNIYSMGPDGDWISVRPESVEIVRILVAGESYALRRTTAFDEQFRSRVEVGRPTGFMFQADALHGYVEFNAYPEDGEALVTSTKPFDVTALDNFDRTEGGAPEKLHPSGFTMTGIQTEITFPTGYEAAIVANLAVALQPEYPGLTLPEVVVAQAAGIKSLIKRRNAQPITLQHERALLPCGRMYR